MTENNPSCGERIAALQARLVELEAKIVEVTGHRDTFGLGAVSGNQLSQKAWRDISEQIEELQQDAAATAAAIRTLQQQEEVERKRLAQEERQRQLDQARGIINQLIAASREIDDAFVALRSKFEQRAELTKQLTATGVMPPSSAFGWNRPWKSAAAARAAGLHGHIGLERVDAQHVRPLAEWDAHAAAVLFPSDPTEDEDAEVAA